MRKTSSASLRHSRERCGSVSRIGLVSQLEKEVDTGAKHAKDVCRALSPGSVISGIFLKFCMTIVVILCVPSQQILLKPAMNIMLFEVARWLLTAY